MGARREFACRQVSPLALEQPHQLASRLKSATIAWASIPFSNFNLNLEPFQYDNLDFKA